MLADPATRRTRSDSSASYHARNSHYSATQLKIIQEVITLAVFAGFAILYLGERIRWNHLAAFVCILAAVAFTFLPKD